MTHNVRLIDVADRPLAVVRRRASRQELSRVVVEGFGVVWGVLRAQRIAGAGRNVAVYLDGAINVEVGVELDSPFSGSGDVTASATPAGRVATTTHFGPYGALHAAHDAIRRWCAANGHALAGPNWEIYGHWEEKWTADPSLIRTEVYYRIAEGTGKRAG